MQPTSDLLPASPPGETSPDASDGAVAVPHAVDVDVDAETIDEMQDRSSLSSRRPLRTLAEVGVMVLILYLVISFFLVEAPVLGSSMAPTLANGQRLLVSHSTYLLSMPQRGDIVVLNDPLGSGRPVARRVVGLPGEKVEMRGRQVLIDNQPLSEPYLNTSLAAVDMMTGTLPFQLRAGELFVMADNRASMNDSRTWGPIKSDAVVGRAWLVYWPPEAIGAVVHERYQATEP